MPSYSLNDLRRAFFGAGLDEEGNINDVEYAALSAALASGWSFAALISEISHVVLPVGFLIDDIDLSGGNFTEIAGIAREFLVGVTVTVIDGPDVGFVWTVTALDPEEPEIPVPCTQGAAIPFGRVVAASTGVSTYPAGTTVTDDSETVSEIVPYATAAAAVVAAIAAAAAGIATHNGDATAHRNLPRMRRGVPFVYEIHNPDYDGGELITDLAGATATDSDHLGMDLYELDPVVTIGGKIHVGQTVVFFISDHPDVAATPMNGLWDLVQQNIGAGMQTYAVRAVKWQDWYLADPHPDEEDWRRLRGGTVFFCQPGERNGAKFFMTESDGFVTDCIPMRNSDYTITTAADWPEVVGAVDGDLIPAQEAMDFLAAR